MKCAKLTCSNEAPEGMKYCSRECAPFARLSNEMPKASVSSASERPGLSAPARRSGSAVSMTARLVASGNVTKPSEHADENTSTRARSAEMNSPEPDTQASPKRSEETRPGRGWYADVTARTLGGPTGETGTDGTETPTSEPSEIVATPEILPAESPKPSSSLDQVASASMSSLDESNGQMMTLLGSLVKSAQATERTADPRLYNAAASLAREIRGAMKTKLEIGRFLHEIRKDARP